MSKKKFEIYLVRNFEMKGEKLYLLWGFNFL